ncbi:MAG: hypothetical protein M3Y75_00175 [Actinomycetota bacterium]|nr:hypothetical protein [Actinomycetota bacterium]
MSEAIFGLVGVLLGAIAAGLGDYLLGKNREKAEVRRSARLLSLELEEARIFIEDSLEELRWVADPERVLSNGVWFEHRGSFAQVKSPDLWRVVSGAFLKVGELRRKNHGAKPGTRLEPGDERYEDAAAVLPGVQVALAALSGFLD